MTQKRSHFSHLIKTRFLPYLALTASTKLLALVVAGPTLVKLRDALKTRLAEHATQDTSAVAQHFLQCQELQHIVAKNKTIVD
jgi:hypothetical protein